MTVRKAARHIPAEQRGEEADVVEERRFSFGTPWHGVGFYDGTETWRSAESACRRDGDVTDTPDTDVIEVPLRDWLGGVLRVRICRDGDGFPAVELGPFYPDDGDEEPFHTWLIPLRAFSETVAFVRKHYEAAMEEA